LFLSPTKEKEAQAHTHMAMAQAPLIDRYVIVGVVYCPGVPGGSHQTAVSVSTLKAEILNKL